MASWWRSVSITMRSVRLERLISDDELDNFSKVGE